MSQIEFKKMFKKLCARTGLWVYMHATPLGVQSTVRSLRNSYKKELTSRKRNSEIHIDQSPGKKRGRKTLLLDDMDNKENGGHITLTKSWAYSLLQRMDYVKRRGSCTAKTEISDEKFDELKFEFHDRVKKIVNEHNIPPDLIYNWDHTGLNYLPVSNWTMEVEGSKKIPIVGLDDKRQITAVNTEGTMTGKFLAPQVIYQGFTSTCHPNYEFPSAWNVTHSPNHLANTETQTLYTEKILVPHMKHYCSARLLKFNQRFE
ncbi:hypothetical protein KUTeg_018725 [Tegillarca granosa]|uniref:Transposase n=1 Tax=Tegillarca granosa TaxID=220873 RepID=A0ABQ9EES6_TEGGR|nr:hypothetical protein KUTeg_018725 [Tegillarca granosa]